MTRMPRNGKSTPSVAAPETRGRDASKTMQWKKLEGARPPSRVSASNERHSRSRSRSLRDEDLTWDGRDSHGREMPFVVGKNTGKSHSVTANLQKVFSMLKTHNPALCSVCSRRRQSKEASRESSKRRDASPQGRRSHREASGSTPPLTDEDEFRGRLRDDQALLHFELAKEGAADGGTEGLERILRFLESEQADYKSNYQHLVREYERLADLGSKNGGKGSHEEQRKLRQIGDELRNVIQDMDSKGDQIRILRDIMASSSRLVTQKAQKSSAKGERIDVPSGE
ncbi:hypothetical protein BC829DRAFT_42139 [Chytridium lagenaria]|nr:hypothetical protein BC829DRAFT_42139 [Chytridium lagenaria]